MWFLLVSSSILGYYAHHLTDDPPTPELVESGGYRTPSIPFKPPKFTPTSSINDNDLGLSEGVSIPLQEIHVVHVGTEGEDNTDSDEPSSIATIKYPRAGRMPSRTMTWVANWFRWIGKSLAIINAIGIVANCVFQYAGVYDNCYCDSSVYTWGSYAFNVIDPIASDIDLARSAWIGALALALTCCTFFVGSIYLVRDALPS